MGLVKISAVIITFNEERNIERCLNSLKGIVDEIVVVDSYSTDKTQTICEKYGVKFVQNPFEGHVQQKNYAVAQAEFDIVLSLDADESLSDQLQHDIQQIKNNWKGDAYAFNRLNNYCGHWVRHCGWYPDRKIRLWDRRMGEWGGINPHDRVVMGEGSNINTISSDLLHYTYSSIEEHMVQINKFSTIAANHAFDNKKKANVLTHLFLYPFFIFVKTYFFQLGFMDGYYGYVISINSAYYRYLKYLKLAEMNGKRSR